MPLRETLQRIEKDIESGDLGKARDRMIGLIATYPDDLSLRVKLGEIYQRLQQPAQAGKYFYLEERKTPLMETACTAFELSCGNDPLTKLLALKWRGDFDLIRETYAGRTLWDLHEKARAKYPFYNDFRERKGSKYRYNRESQGGPRRLRRGYWLGCLIGLVVAAVTLGLVFIGMIAVVQWLS